MVTSFFGITKTWAPYDPAISQACLRLLNKFNIRVLQFCPLPWVKQFICIYGLHKSWATAVWGLVWCPSVWVRGCWVSISYYEHLNLGHKSSGRGVPGDCSYRTGGILVVRGLCQVCATECLRVQVSPLWQWHQLTMQCRVSLILIPSASSALLREWSTG